MKSAAQDRAALLADYFFSHFWLATPQLVLQADWQEVWHSPQPPFLALSQRLRVSRVWILFIRYFSHLKLDFVFAGTFYLGKFSIERAESQGNFPLGEAAGGKISASPGKHVLDRRLIGCYNDSPD